MNRGPLGNCWDCGAGAEDPCMCEVIVQASPKLTDCTRCGCEIEAGRQWGACGYVRPATARAEKRRRERDERKEAGL